MTSTVSSPWTRTTTWPESQTKSYLEPQRKDIRRAPTRLNVCVVMKSGRLTAVPRSRARGVIVPIVAGGLVAATLDILDAWVFFGLRGVSPIVIPQSIASGLLGRAAYQGGVRTAAIGLVLHLFIAHVVAAVFVIASRLWPALVARPLMWGSLYGVCVFFAMRNIVLPLAGLPPGTFSWPVFLNGITIHVLGIGIPIALIARRWLQRPTSEA